MMKFEKYRNENNDIEKDSDSSDIDKNLSYKLKAILSIINNNKVDCLNNN